MGGKKLQSKESGQAAPHYPLPLLPGLCMLESPGLTQHTSNGHQRSAHLKLRTHSLICAYFLPPFLILSVCISPRQIEDPTGSPPWDVPQDCKQECRIQTGPVPKAYSPFRALQQSDARRKMYFAPGIQKGNWQASINKHYGKCLHIATLTFINYYI